MVFVVIWTTRSCSRSAEAEIAGMTHVGRIAVLCFMDLEVIE